MLKIIKIIFLSLISLNIAQADVFPANTQYQVCFTPQENCTGEIISIIDRAKKNIYFQAYSFTSNAIAHALVRAQKRGVKVYAILDKSEFTGEYYTSAQILMHNHVPIWNDDTLNIAHNKVLIIDESIVQTGSFNYTVAAQHRNAENVFIIYSDAVAKNYLANWHYRQKVSKIER